MKMWLKVLIAFIGSGSIGALTFYVAQADLSPQLAQVFTYVNLAISGGMSVAIGWPPKES